MQKTANLIVAALAAIAVVSPFVIFMALPVFDGGVFRQVETVSVGLHVLASATAMLLMLLTTVAPAAVSHSISKPALWIAAIAALGALLATFGFGDDWRRSLHGTMEHGVGILWHLELAILVLGFHVAWRDRPEWRVAMALGAPISVAICAILHLTKPVWSEGVTFTVYDFPEYIGINALFAAVPLLALRRRWSVAMAITIALAGTVVAANRSVGLALAIALLGIVLARRCHDQRKLSQAAASLAVAATLAIAVALPLLAPVFQGVAISSVSVAPGIPSTAPIDHVAIATKPYGTLWQRSVTARLVAHDVLADPAHLIAGRGFGAFDTVAQTRSREAPGRRMQTPLPTASLAYWDGDQKAAFHSHNALLETVLSVGLLGGLLWLGFVYSVGREIRAWRPEAAITFLSAIVVGGSLWFFVNAAAPLIALGLVAVLNPAARRSGPLVQPNLNSVSLSSVIMTLGFGLVSICFAAAAAFAYSAAAGARFERAFVPLPAVPAGVCSGFSAVSMPSHELNAQLYRVMLRRIEARPDQLAIVDLAMLRNNIASYSCLMRSYAARGDVLGAMTSLDARWRLAQVLGSDNPILLKTLSEDFAFWGDDLDLYLKLAPGRTDKVIPFITWLDAEKRPQEVVAAVGRFLPRTIETDPVRHWLLAKQAQALGDKRAYQTAIKRALELGLANLMPIDLAVVRSFFEARS
ncbi:hypothetical protein [Bosea sp. RAC05]|uniref:hypothetical protein n=1 Tax=Bosea sp. RAC05 TaxID=1842539 RepID=UPI00083E3B00|nr:hypothetical protein [Bosea sp. RAC05]AOG02808.1 O-antigen ligase like membrane family protein [Bosea sp. RAC05]